METGMSDISAVVWAIPPWYYLLDAICLSGFVRVVLTLFRCYRHVQEGIEGDPPFMHCFGRLLIGKPAVDLRSVSEKDRERCRGDYLAPFFLGFLELFMFPILFAAGLQLYVGAWIGLKLVAQYKHWADDRNAFNAFLVGNALVLTISAMFLQRFVFFEE
jgi:hypothetical protein